MAEQSAHPSNKVMIVVIQAQDIDNAESALCDLGLNVFRLPSIGGFLGRRNATLLVSMTPGKEQAAINEIRKNCKQRVEYIAVPIESAPLPLPSPTPVTVGGATLFDLPIDRYEEF
ncbi:MAG: cyclic-di-AMP receptor [Anaerolineaceae bacterium]